MPDQDSPLAAMITALDVARARVEAVDTALKAGATWAAIGTVYGLTGPEAKKRVHGLREQVKRAERLGSPS